MNGKTVFACMLVIGFIVLTGIGMFHAIPESNVKTIDGAMVALGTALGAAVMALLRNSQSDEIKAANTGKALDTIGAALSASPATEQASGKEDDPFNVREVQP